MISLATAQAFLRRTRGFGALLLAALVPLGCALEPESTNGSGVAEEPAVIQPLELQAAPSFELADAELEHLARFRSELGLEADPQWIRELHEDPAGYGGLMAQDDQLGGLVVTDSEAHALDIRNRLQKAAEALEHWATEHVPSYAGALLEADGQPGGVLVLQFSEDVGDQHAELAALLPADLAPRLVLRKVDRSLTELRVAEEEVARIARALGDEVTGTSIDVAHNTVTAFVRNGETRQSLAEALGPGRDVRYVEGLRGGPTWVMKNEPLIYNLVDGGQHITDAFGSASCTSSFAASGYYGPFILTAAHCFPHGQQIYQGGAVMGHVAAHQDGGWVDAAAISTSGHRNQGGRFHRNADDPWSPIHFAVGRDADPIGAVVCQAGVTTTGLDGYQRPGERCGTLQHKWFRPSWVPNAEAVFRIAGYIARPGDSGGTVYWDTGYGVGGVGITQGAMYDQYGPYAAVYTHLPYVLDMWGLRLDAP